MRRRPGELSLSRCLLGAILVVGVVLLGVSWYCEYTSTLRVDAMLAFCDAPARLRSWNDLGWREAETKEVLHEGDSVEAASFGRTVVSIAATASLRLAPSTHVQFVELRRTKSGILAHVKIVKGRLWLEQAGKVQCLVQSESGDIECLGRGVDVEVTPSDTRVRTWKGTARCLASRGSAARAMSASHQYVVPGKGPMTEGGLPPADDWAVWNLSVNVRQVAEGTLPHVLTAKERAALATTGRLPERVAALGSSSSAGSGSSGAAAAAAPVPGASGNALGQTRYAPGGGGAAAPTRPAEALPPARSVAAAPTRSEAPPSMASRSSSSSARRGYQSHSTWQAPNWLTRKGAPSVSCRTEATLAGLDSYSESQVRAAYQRVASKLEQRYNLSLRNPVIIQVVTSEHPGPLHCDYYVSEILKCESDENQHRCYLAGGLAADQVYAFLGHVHAYAWYMENARPHTSPSQNERYGFCLWMQYKTLVELGATQQGTAMISRNAMLYGSGRATEAMAGMLAVERDFGEYGVFHTVIHGHPQDL